MQMIERFRHYFEHECDSNAKLLAMLESIPAEKQADPDFNRAIEKTSHIALARKIWLFRLGVSKSAPTSFFQVMPLAELKQLFAETEADWKKYLASLTEADLSKTFDYVRQGVNLRYHIEGALTQLNGHAWYHRGQVASLAHKLGGKFVDTDYVFWNQPTKL